MPHLHLGKQLVEADLIIFDKDGVLQDFAALWITLSRLRARAIALAAGRPDWLPAITTLLGLTVEGRVDPTGLLAVGTRAESLLAIATWLHMQGRSWPDARRLATVGFETADREADLWAHTLPLPGVPETLEALAAAGWLMAVATSDTTEGAERFLQKVGVGHHFVSVVGSDRVKKGKPDAEMAHLVCSEAGVAAKRAVMVGDSLPDLQMGRAAGVAAAVGVLSGVGDRQRLAPLADALLPDIRALL